MELPLVTTETKEILLPTPKLIVFDMDGTLIDEPEFYHAVYSGTLNQVVEETKGPEGLQTLAWCRQNLEGKGELALIALGIPFRLWAEKLIDAPVDAVTPRPDVVAAIRSIQSKKILFTGSPLAMADRLLTKFGFNPRNDFDLIVGWKEPELYPLKWNCSSYVFETLTALADSEPENVWSVGDNWETDLAPAQRVGLKTIQIRKNTGSPDARYKTIIDLVTATKKAGIL